MAQAFRRLKDGRISGILELEERALLCLFFKDVIGILEPEDSGEEDPLVAIVGMDMSSVRPQDPILLRLLPDAIVDDEAEALEFRRLTERSLRTAKMERLREALRLLEPEGWGRGFNESDNAVIFEAAQARKFAQAINDVRLAMSVRLGINSDEDAERVNNYSGTELNRAGYPDEKHIAVVYNFVAWLQESLMQVLLEDLEHDEKHRRRVLDNPDNFSF